MCRVFSVMSQVVLASGLLAGAVPVEARVEHPKASSSAGGPDRLRYLIDFALRMTNRGTDAVLMGIGPLVVTLVEIRIEDGSWLILNQNDVFDFGKSSKYSPCSALAPGASLEVGRTTTFLNVPRSRSSQVGVEPTIRLSFIAPCVGIGGSLTLPSAVSEPFVLGIGPPARTGR
jgi:hypothetical protein